MLEKQYFIPEPEEFMAESPMTAEMRAIKKQRDEEIREILDKAGVSRPITSRDRDAYRTWTYSWQMPKNVILHSATLAMGSGNPVSYMNSLLGAWHNAGIRDIEKAKAYRPADKESASTATTVVKSYTSEQLNALFDNLDYEDL